jgi:general secretion pathway protein G
MSSDFKCSILIIAVVFVIFLGIFSKELFPPSFYDNSSPGTGTKTNISTISTALDAFDVDLQRYPTTEEGLGALYIRPARLAADQPWRGPYLKGHDTLKDGWGREIRYLCPGKHYAEGYDLISAGRDGKFDTDDDIANYSLSE